jgi:plasmid maintenance system antidote protein VapI
MMKRRYKTYTQNDFAELLGIDQPRASKLLKGIEKVSFPLAVELARLFPGRDIIGWKNATPTDLTRLYNQLKAEAKADAKEVA